MKPSYELVIIGGGPAGMTAAVYAARRKIDTLLVGHEMGGQTTWSADVENYLGFNMITGADLATKFYQHVKRFDDDNAQFDLEVAAGVEVATLARRSAGFQLSLKDGQRTSCASVIIASGKVPRLLKIPGEQELLGRGVTFCATCDAPLYRGRDVAVVGGGNSALDAALQLVKIARSVVVITINHALVGEQVMIDHLAQSNKAKVYTEAETVAILGQQQVSGITIHHLGTGQEETLAVQGVFEEVGSVPAVDFCRGLVALNERDEVVIDSQMRTNVPGLFAAGDVTSVAYKQIVVAAGEGCKAALEAHQYLIRRQQARGAR